MVLLDSEIERRSFLKAGWAWTLVPHALHGSDKAMAASKRCARTFNARICSTEFEFRPQKLAMPLKLSSGIIEEVTEAVATVVVELADGTHRGVGRGSIYLSDVWAWPHAAIPRRECEVTLRQVCQSTAQRLPDLTQEESLHPTELGLRLHHWVCEELEIAEDPPPLARAMCSSPLDAAIHDAVGAALGISAFSLYDEPVALPSADPYFPQGGAAAAIATLLCKPRRSFPAWYIVNQSDAKKNILAEAVKRHGYFCFKLKISGSDATADATSTSVVYRAARELGISAPRLTVDSNEANPDAASVMEYLDILESLDPDAYQALEYLEQPTRRDISRATFDWRPIATRKPVLLDEGLTDLTVLPLAKSQGWSGVALKTCKGHGMLLVSAAWARQHHLLMSLQDLTNPGIALIHAAQVGSRLPTLNGVELNSPQFTPAANRDFLPRLRCLFEPQRGMHHLPDTTPVGLGSRM